MALDLAKLLNTDLNYPGISFGYESWALETYLKALDDHLPTAQDQYRVRAERDLERHRGELASEEIGAKLWEIEEAADGQIPRFFRIGAIISIWGLFESFVSDIADYVARREGLQIGMRDIRASHFRQQAEKFFEGFLRIDLPWPKEDRDRLSRLQELRNLIAHRNGRVSDLSAQRREEIIRLLADVRGVTIERDALIIASDYIAEASKLVFGLVGSLNQLVSDRYDGPLVPSSGT